MEFVNICSLPLLLVAQLIQFKHVFIPLAGCPCSFQGWLDPISAAPVLPFEWQLLTFQTSVNCRIWFRKHLLCTPVTRYPQHLYPCLLWGSLQLPDDLQLYLVLQVSAIHWQFTCFVIGFQCKIPFLSLMYRKLYLLKILSSLKNSLYKSSSFSAKEFSKFPWSAPLREQRTTENSWIAFFSPAKIPPHWDIFPFFI